MVPPLFFLLIDAGLVSAVDILIFALEVILAVGGVEALLVVIWVVVELGGAVEFGGDFSRVVMVVVWVVESSLIEIVGGVQEVRKVVFRPWMRVNLVVAECNFSLMGTSQGLSDLRFLSSIIILNFEKIFVDPVLLIREMIELPWWFR